MHLLAAVLFISILKSDDSAKLAAALLAILMRATLNDVRLLSLTNSEFAPDIKYF